MRPALLLLPALLAACGTQGQALSVTTRFWQAAMDNDAATVSQLITLPQQAGYVASGDNLYHNFSVDGRGKRGVRVTLGGRFCYPDLHTETILSEDRGEEKVDLVETLKQMRTDLTGVKPLRKYCYSFTDQQLAGKLSGRPWQFSHVDARSGQALALVSSDNGTRVLLHLHFNNEGGNFSAFNYVLLQAPDGRQRRIDEGSFRVARLADGRMQLALSFKASEDTFLSGHVLIEQRQLRHLQD